MKQWTNDPSRLGETPSSRPDTADLLVIGGGVLGLATACEILSKGHSVTIFDPAPESSATVASAGMLSPYAELVDDSSLIDQMKAARTGYPEFIRNIEEVSGCRIELQFPGTLLTSLDGSVPGLDEQASRYRDMGASCRYIPAQALAELEPALGCHEPGAVLLEDEGYVDPRGLHTALRSAFEKLGGRWVSLQVKHLVLRGDRVAAVDTATGTSYGDAVLNAAGAAADQFLLPDAVGHLKPRPVRGELVRLRPPNGAAGVRHVIQVPGCLYLVPQADGTVVAGATSAEDGPFRRTTAGGVGQILTAAHRVIPESASWDFLEAWNGLRPMVGNGDPVLFADRRKGLFHGLGLYRHGILLAPVASTRLAKMIQDYLDDPSGGR